MLIATKDGKILLKDGKVAISDSPCTCCGTCLLSCFPTPGEKVLILVGHVTSSAKDAALNSEEVDITSSFQLGKGYSDPINDGSWLPGTGTVGSQYRDVPWRDSGVNPQSIKLTVHSAAAYVALTCTLKAKYLSKTHSAAHSGSAKLDSDYYGGGRWPDFDRFIALVFGGWSAPSPVDITDHENPVVTFAAASRTSPAISLTLTYNRATTTLGYTVTGSETGGRPVGGSVTDSTAWDVFPGFNTDTNGRKDLSIPWETWNGSAWVAASDYVIQVYMRRTTVGVIQEWTDAEQDFPMSMSGDGHYGSLRSADTWTETGRSILSQTVRTPPACERYWTTPAHSGTDVNIDITPVDLNLFSVASTVDPLDVADSSADLWIRTKRISLDLTYPGGAGSWPTTINVVMSRLKSPYRWEVTSIDELLSTQWTFTYSVDTAFVPTTVGSTSLVTASLVIHEDVPSPPALATVALNHSFQRLGAIESDLAWIGLHINSLEYTFGPTRVVQSTSPVVCGAFLPKASYMGEEWDTTYPTMQTDLIDTGAGGSLYTERPGTRTVTLDVAAQTFSIHFVARCQTATTYDLTFNLSGTFNAGAIQTQTVDLSGAGMGAVGTHTVTLRAWVFGYQYGERFIIPTKIGGIPGDNSDGHSWANSNNVAAVIAYTGVGLPRSGIPYTEVLPVFVDANGTSHAAIYAFTALALKVSKGVLTCTGFPESPFFGVPYQPIDWAVGFLTQGSGGPQGTQITMGTCSGTSYTVVASASQYYGGTNSGGCMYGYTDHTPYKAGFDPDWDRIRDPLTVVWRGGTAENTTSTITFTEA